MICLKACAERFCPWASLKIGVLRSALDASGTNLCVFQGACPNRLRLRPWEGKRKGQGQQCKKKGGAPGDEIRQWGKAIGVDGTGRPNLFELDLGGGKKVITHVLWAD